MLNAFQGLKNTQPQSCPVSADTVHSTAQHRTKECFLPQLCCACACYVWSGRGRAVQSNAKQCRAMQSSEAYLHPPLVPKDACRTHVEFPCSPNFEFNICYMINSFCYNMLQFVTLSLNVNVEFFWCGAGRHVSPVCRSSPSLRWARTKRSMPVVRVHFPSGHGAKTGHGALCRVNFLLSFWIIVDVCCQILPYVAILSESWPCWPQKRSFKWNPRVAWGTPAQVHARVPEDVGSTLAQ